MADSSERGAPPRDPFSTWVQASTDALNALAGLWFPPSTDHREEKTAGGTDTLLNLWQNQMRTLAALQQGFMGTGGIEGANKLFAMMPDLALRLMQNAANGFSTFQTRWAEQLERAKASGAYRFDELDQDFLNRWTEVYLQEFQKFLKMPQLGLTRFHQEKINDVLDRYHLFQAAANELVHLLSIPLIKSIQVLQDQLARMAEKGDLPEDSHRIYRMWIRILEGHYMTLFQSPAYSGAMSKAITAMNAFLTARREAMEPLLKAIPVPTQKELDELYREIYLLKKRIRDLEDGRTGHLGEKG
jgi:polyhydroxyalkanoate synthase subunit PhaE